MIVPKSTKHPPYNRKPLPLRFALMARQSTRDNLVSNLKWLMETMGWNQVDVSKRSGVSQKSISKILRSEMVPTIELADKLAAAFGLSGWHLIMPDLPRDLIGSTSLEKLFKDFILSDDAGRELIQHVAAREAKHHSNGE